jgi:acyl-CoA thioester hydrolase
MAARFRVRYAETDKMGIAHHSNYVIWMELGRVEWLKEQGLDYRQLESEGVALAVAAIDLQYRASAFFDDELEVKTILSELKSRRLRFDYQIARVSDQTLLALGSSIHIPTNEQNQAVRFPAHWLDELATKVTRG